MARVTDFQVIDHGIDGSQYFPGCGTTFTDFDYVVTGNGDTFAEAIEDALETMAQGDEVEGQDFDDLERRIAAEGYGELVDGRVKWQTSQSALAECLKSNGMSAEELYEEGAGDDDDEAAQEYVKKREELIENADVYYYVSIRYNVAS